MVTWIENCKELKNKGPDTPIQELIDAGLCWAGSDNFPPDKDYKECYGGAACYDADGLKKSCTKLANCLAVDTLDGCDVNQINAACPGVDDAEALLGCLQDSFTSWSCDLLEDYPADDEKRKAKSALEKAPQRKKA